jgi:hypothetical protein
LKKRLSEVEKHEKEESELLITMKRLLNNPRVIEALSRIELTDEE